MKIIVGIPTGQRAEQAVKVAEAWKDRGIEVCILTWDTETASRLMFADHLITVDKRESFGVNQNRMMDTIKDWDVWICGADDLWPGRQKDIASRIELVASNAGDRLIWVGDGLHNAQPTHPVIPRPLYDSEKPIFDEEYLHNFVDTDLFARMLVKDRVVKCFDIMFDHRHFSAVNLTQKSKEDEIYRIGQSSYPHDASLFHKKWGSQTISTLNVEEVEIEADA